LYEAARKREALCYRAAKLILNNVQKGSNIAITTGFLLPEGIETDGINGAIIMARFFNEMKANVFVLAENDVIKILKEMNQFSGKINFISLSDIEIIKEMDFSMAIAIERPGIGKDGKYHDMHGNIISAQKIDFLFDGKIPTIGIGDGGNEIGMGKIFHAIPDKRIASITKADEIVIGGVSNWGAYGIIASLSILTGKNYCHNGAMEAKMIKKCVDSGAIDGVTREREYSIDAIPSKVHESIVNMLYNIVASII